MIQGNYYKVQGEPLSMKYIGSNNKYFIFEKADGVKVFILTSAEKYIKEYVYNN